MANRLRVALPGYNALTDTDPDHYALYSDQDYVLIKEKARGSTTVNAGSTTTIAHGLSYVPFFMAYATDGTYQNWIYGFNIYASFFAWADTTNIYLRNTSGTARVFQYYIFYDQQV